MAKRTDPIIKLRKKLKHMGHTPLHFITSGCDGLMDYYVVEWQADMLRRARIYEGDDLAEIKWYTKQRGLWPAPVHTWRDPQWAIPK